MVGVLVNIEMRERGSGGRRGGASIAVDRGSSGSYPRPPRHQGLLALPWPTWPPATHLPQGRRCPKAPNPKLSPRLGYGPCHVGIALTSWQCPVQPIPTSYVCCNIFKRCLSNIHRGSLACDGGRHSYRTLRPPAIFSHHRVQCHPLHYLAGRTQPC